MESELCALRPEKKKPLLQGANPCADTSRSCLATKADMVLPWAKMRVISR